MNKNKSVLQMGMLLVAAFVFAACSGPGDDQAKHEEVAKNESATPVTPALATLLTSDSRAAEDRARDASRKPAEVVAIVGIDSGMRVLDLIAGGGYYTEVLSLAVGPEGHVVSQNPAVVLEMREGVNEKALSARLANDRLSNVTRLNKEMKELSATDGPFDAVFTALNLHDIYNNFGEEGATNVLKTVFALLKPGGVFGVIDHNGLAGNDNKALHRVAVADAIRVAKAAGFTVEESSGILHAHSDDMSQSVFADDVRGKTHRFLLRLRKPEA